jgi:acyl dehydratase
MAKAYSELEAGYEFPPGSYTLDAARVALFLKAVEDSSYPYLENRIVPPMAVAALAMSSLSNTISLPPGSIHVSQEISFVEPVRPDENLTSHAKLSRTQKRGKLHLIAVDFDVRNQAGKTVLTGKTSFILPQTEGEH